MRSLLTVAIVLACLSLPLLAQGQVWVVDPAGPLTEISDAVAVAASGDTILVRPGGYDAFFVAGKSLVIQGDPSATVFNLVLPPFFPGFPGPAVRISGLAADQQVVLRNLDIGIRYLEPVPALEVAGCAGPVHLEDLVLTSSNGSAVNVLGSASVVLQRCTLVSEGPFLPNGELEHDPNPGLRHVNSQVYVFDSVVTGSAGHDALALLSNPPSDGGPGAQVLGGRLYLSGSALAGGQGGDYDPLAPPSCVAPADGGAGLVMDVVGATRSRVVLFDTSVQGGAGGVQVPTCTQFPDGVAGPDQVLLAGTLVHVAGAAPRFSWDSPVRDATPFGIHSQGEPGDAVFLLFSVGVTSGVLFQPSQLVLNVDPLGFELIFLGVLPAGSALDEVVVAPSLPPGFETVGITGQAASVDPQDPLAPLLISGPSLLTLVDDSF